jgi:hypothetical protein
MRTLLLARKKAKNKLIRPFGRMPMSNYISYKELLFHVKLILFSDKLVDSDTRDIISGRLFKGIERIQKQKENKKKT